ncbi:hypothetical protein [Microbacterium sp. VKM Ac-2923]|uniref:hypothetical protein n=1 Tax=Microbacterium sp. VKM Ac-2923 TaxID=2929476 RepID=UPI001FB1BBC8|nr:hypothetical protein [Microbacterium sp. VKM Ac-2923]MCJ1706328.1 hypothetical protein [Microbacterium sp. VKM Ac-2923]
MSGPHGGADDPDDVTLWAGRLRPWPVSPVVDGVDDETVRSRRATPGDHGTVSPRTVEPEGDARCERSAGEAGRDVDSPGTVDTDGRTFSPVRPAHPAAGDVASPGAVEPDERTFPRARTANPSGRDLHPSVAVESDDDTLRSRPGGAAVGDIGSSGVVDPDEQTSPRSRPADPTASDVRAPGLVESGEETLRSVSGDAETGARPRSGGAPRPLIAGDPPPGRDAHAPVALHRESYSPRLDASVRVPRTAAGRMVPTGDSASRRPRRPPHWRRLILLATAMVAIVTLAAVGVILLLG